MAADQTNCAFRSTLRKFTSFADDLICRNSQGRCSILFRLRLIAQCSSFVAELAIVNYWSRLSLFVSSEPYFKTATAALRKVAEFNWVDVSGRSGLSRLPVSILLLC